MAKTPAAAMDLMMRVWPAAKARVAEEVRDMQAIRRQGRGEDHIEPWDYRFYQEKVRKSRYDLDQAELKPYFELNNIIQGSLYAANRLYGLEFKEITGTVPVFEPNMRVWHVTRNGKEVGCSTATISRGRASVRVPGPTPIAAQRNLPPVQNVLSSNNNNFAKGAKASRCSSAWTMPRRCSTNSATRSTRCCRT